ncbi:MAG: DUF3137 domain-containing protein [Pseudomonadota bacterium]
MNEDRAVLDPQLASLVEGLPDDFKRFARLYDAEIRPALQAREEDRRRATSTARQATLGGLVVGGVGVLAGLAVFNQPIVAIVSGLVGAAAIAIGRSPLGKLKQQAKGLFVAPIAERFQIDFMQEPGFVETARHLRDIGLLPRFDRSRFEDRMVGQRKGIDFEFFEAHLKQRRTETRNGRTHTKYVTVFKGQCLRFSFHKRFYGKTLVTRDAGIFNRLGSWTKGWSGMERASLEDPTFEKAFEVYTTDQVEARFILTPDLMQRLVDLEQVFKGKSLRCGFVGEEMLVAVEGDNLFEPGSMFAPMDDPKRVRGILDDFAVVFTLIESVTQARETEAAERG